LASAKVFSQERERPTISNGRRKYRGRRKGNTLYEKNLSDQRGESCHPPRWVRKREGGSSLNCAREEETSHPAGGQGERHRKLAKTGGEVRKKKKGGVFLVEVRREKGREPRKGFWQHLDFKERKRKKKSPSLSARSLSKKGSMVPDKTPSHEDEQCKRESARTARVGS